MKTKIASLLVIPALSACVMSGPRFATPLPMYEGAQLDDAQVATIMTYDKSVKPDNFLERLWLSRVIEVDGAPVKDLGWEFGKIQVRPGEHVLTMTCEIFGLPKQTAKVNVNLAAGRIWYPWAKVPLYMGKPYADGRCQPYLKTTSPTAGWTGDLKP